MFAVPGWSVSADKLKAESATKAAPAAAAAAAAQGVPGPSTKGTGANATQLFAPPPAKKQKKRKRPPPPQGGAGAEVTADNVAELWERVIEKKEPVPAPAPAPAPSAAADGSRPAKKPRRAKKGEHKGAASEGRGPAAQPTKDANAPAKTEKQEGTDAANRKKGGKDGHNGHKNRGKEAAAQPDQARAVSALPAPALPPAPATLTPLQASMRAKLVSARFRHLNETLYTQPSAEARRLFSESPDMFAAYHEGFRQQVAVWPENPVDGYIADVRRRASLGVGSGRGRGRDGRDGRDGGDLPRTRGVCRLADIGCGDARLAAALAADAARLRVTVLSYDLHADRAAHPLVTAAADAADLPLADAAVDVAVFCLALMGTNWLAFVEEAYRVLRWKGELWVAEIKSRFAGGAELRARAKMASSQAAGGGGGGSRRGPVAHSVGFRRKGNNNKSKGGAAAADDNDHDPDAVAAALAEVDGGGPGAGAGATDVAAFVRALRRRGFVLDESAADPSSPAVDLGNKMFVKLRFVKAAPPVVGKDSVMAALASGRDDNKKSKYSVRDTSDPMDDPALEAKILKPCVYKLR